MLNAITPFPPGGYDQPPPPPPPSPQEVEERGGKEVVMCTSTCIGRGGEEGHFYDV